MPEDAVVVAGLLVVVVRVVVVVDAGLLVLVAGRTSAIPTGAPVVTRLVAVAGGTVVAAGTLA